LNAFTLVGKDDSGAESSTAMQVQVAVTVVNDMPSFTMGANQTINEDAGAQTVSQWATNLSIGPSNEASQVLNFIVSNNNNSLFSVQPTLNASGTLAYTPASNAYGSATVTVQAHDNGGTANSGSDTSAAQTFTITANPINDKPVLNAGTGYLSLNGSTDLRANIDEPGTNVSREIVFRTTVGGTLFSVEGGGNDRHLIVESDGNIYSRVWNNETIRSTGLNLTDGNFHTLLFTLGSGGTNIYIDGNLVKHGDKTASAFDYTVTYQRIGASYIDGPKFTGDIVSYRAWDTELNASQDRKSVV
jgi:hypothetical protein